MKIYFLEEYKTCIFRMFLKLGKSETHYLSVTETNLNWSVQVPETHRYEFTITFNSKFFVNNEDMDEQVPKILEAMLIKAGARLTQGFPKCYFNFVKEFTKIGAPHVHGTIMFNHRIPTTSQHNWEQMCRRYWGKTDIYYTGVYDKHHKNDHYDGKWSQYLLKDCPENYKSFVVEKIFCNFQHFENIFN